VPFLDRPDTQELIKGATLEHFSDTAAARVREYLSVDFMGIIPKRDQRPFIAKK
jgi:hypothetical protein